MWNEQQLVYGGRGGQLVFGHAGGRGEYHHSGKCVGGGGDAGRDGAAGAGASDGHGALRHDQCGEDHRRRGDDGSAVSVGGVEGPGAGQRDLQLLGGCGQSDGQCHYGCGSAGAAAGRGDRGGDQRWGQPDCRGSGVDASQFRRGQHDPSGSGGDGGGDGPAGGYSQRRGGAAACGGLGGGSASGEGGDGGR